MASQKVTELAQKMLTQLASERLTEAKIDLVGASGEEVVIVVIPKRFIKLSEQRQDAAPMSLLSTNVCRLCGR